MTYINIFKCKSLRSEKMGEGTVKLGRLDYLRIYFHDVEGHIFLDFVCVFVCLFSMVLFIFAQ